MNTSHGGRFSRPEQGVALVVTLLFTGIVLMIIVMTSATLVTGARSGGAEERRAYQALLAAESGLNTVMVRVNRRLTSTPYTGSTQTDLQTWLGGLNSDPEAALFPATLTFTPNSADTFTVESRGSAAGAVKIALQDFTLKPVYLSTGMRLRAALTSLPRINANGNATITGQSNRGQITTLAGTGVSAALGSSVVTVTVTDASGLTRGDYVQVPAGTAGQRFRVDGISGAQLSLTSVPGPLATALAATAGTGVDLILNAAAQTTTSVTDPLTQRVSNAADFTPGEVVTVGGFKATVTAISSSGSGPDGLVLDWQAGQPAAIPEGTEITRDLSAMRSANAIDVKDTDKALSNFTMDGSQDCVITGTKPNTSVKCEGAADPLLTNGSALEADKFFTQQLLGMTDTQLNELVPLSYPDASGKFPPMVNAIRRIRAQDFDAMLKNSTSSGLLIVDGDINSNVNGNTIFNGFIYFRGNQGGKFNGNLTVNGAIAVRGGPIEGITTDDVVTDITGSLNINFNAVKLRQLLMNTRGGLTLNDTQGTWRQR
ncbi:pilus assembly PilX family protein [Deinococcus soli (ex Cha et al. 2016)]|uniref:pilus assembly PilX family protein n=1 Tax=Deinococcus soli (ex Cha et al. 2016) TaxID=1309411 RepID=UPI000A840451|nr:pilus assembly PilX N-terminal domain-containing protein [Deinococcus soli (ex Cha et al. 2016)]